jgi:predicted lipoprotein with Yx(FWY)xxD motif
MMRSRWLAPAVLGAAAITAAACGASTGAGGSASPASHSSAPAAAASPSASGTALKTTTIGGKMVLTDAKGLTLYWFVPDTATKSNCNGQCATFWPPVKGPATAGGGVTGKLTTITRSDGSMQAAYNGHPLYTYIGDHAPGQDTGNGKNLSGGLWYVVPVSGSAAPASSPASSPSGSSGGSSGGGGGYGGGY